MVLQPRKFKFKVRQKLRKLSKIKSSRKKFIFGHVGLVLNQPIRLNSMRLFRIKLFLKRAARRGDNTRRKIWVNAFPHLPITKKVIGARMGKGKGKLSIWATQLYTGHLLIEFKNLRNGRVKYYLRQTRYKLGGIFKIIWKKSNYRVFLNFMGTSHVNNQSFW
jgi:large subunit ribosomal protein L16